MKFSTEYGYLIKALREYPFNEQIKRRCEEIEYPLRKSDINSGIKTNYHENNPKVLLDLIKKESDPILHKYQLYSKAIDLAKSKLTLKEWALIEDVYIKNSTNVDNAAFKYFQRGKDFAYDKIIKPFFSEIENVYPDAIAIKHVAKETLVINERFIIANTTGISNVKQIAFTYTFTKSKSNFIAFIIFAISILLYL